METVELKNKINEYLSRADYKALMLVKVLLETYQDSEEDFFEQLPEEIQSLLTKSRADINKGVFQSHDSVVAEFKEKYKVGK